MSLLKIIGSNFAGRNLRGYRQHRRESFVRIKETVDEMKISGSAAAGADSEIACQLCLGTRRKGTGFLVPNVHPLNPFVVVNRIYNAVQGIADHSVNSADARGYQSFDQMFSNGFHARFFLISRFLVALGFAVFPGSPVAAFSTSPALSRAIFASSLLLKTERGCEAVMSLSDAYLSRCLINSQDLPNLLPKPRVRTKTQDPRSFLPS